MSEVTFTPEQVKEIRRRIERSHGVFINGAKENLLAAFPLPKVTRLRTFRAMVDTYRVNGDRVEYLTPNGKDWLEAMEGQSRERFAKSLARGGKWQDLATFADICARPTEEVTDDGR